MAPDTTYTKRVDVIRPEDFALPSAELTETLRAVTKELFDYAKQHDTHGCGVLGELYVANFDLEQIWEQLQLHNGPLLRHLEKSVRSLVAQRDQIDLTAADSQGEEGSEQGTEGAEGEEAEGDGSGVLDLGGGGARDARTGPDAKRKAGVARTAERGDAGRRGADGSRRARVETSVDDLLDEMDSFVEQAERGQVNGPDDEEGEEEDGEDGEDDEGEDEFGIGIDGEEGEEGEDDEDDEGEEGEEDEEGWGESGEEDAMEEGEEGEGGGRAADPRGGASSDDEEGEGEGEAGVPAGAAPRSLSAHELRLLRMQEKVAALEEANVASKPWQLRGEAAAAHRPLNSLLEEHIDFEAAARPAPAVTQEVTASIEDLIKARVLQGLYDDVERKAPVDARRLRPREAVLSQEKSKQGLAQEYEEAFREGPMGQDKAAGRLSARHAELAQLLAALCGQLDSLSSAHFTPHPAQPQAEVRPNLPALRMEEAMPAALSLAHGLSAAEVKAPQHARSLPSAAELDRSERRAKRNAHKHRNARDKRRRVGADRERPMGEGEKLEKELAAAKRSKTARVTTAEKGRDQDKARPSYTRSAQLFGKLQKEQGKQPRRTTAAERAAQNAGVSPATIKL